jgi:glycosyltransferase involved in cell wall biosynthesis
MSVAIIAKNEAARIGDALASAAWADELIVVDARSADETVAVARRYTNRVVIRDWPGFVEQKNYAASLATNDWILSLDADERLTPALSDEIRATLRGEPPHRAYEVPRVTWHLGRWIRTTDWYPDFQFRLYDRRAARWTGRFVHESLAVDGTIGRLRADLEHRPYDGIADHLATIHSYTTLAARQMRQQGRRASVASMLAHPPLAFLRNYVWKRGFADGAPGLIVSAMNAYYVFLKFAKLWELDGVAVQVHHEDADTTTKNAI